MTLESREKKGLQAGAFSFLIVLFCLALSFHFSPNAVAEARGPKRLPATSHVSYSLILTFKKGSNELSKTDHDQLTALMKTIKERSQKIEQAHLAVWGDHAVAMAANANEPSAATLGDRSLAESRIQTVESELEGPLGISYVETYNMSERSNWFARALKASATDVKKLFANKGAPQNVTPEDFAIVKTKGAPSRAVILIELDPASTVSGDN